MNLKALRTVPILCPQKMLVIIITPSSASSL